MKIGNLPESEVHIGQPRLLIEKELSSEGIVASGQEIVFDPGVRVEEVEIPLQISANVESHLQTLRSYARSGDPVIIDVSDKIAGLVWMAKITAVEVEQIVKPSYAVARITAKKLPCWGTTLINGDIEATILDLDGIEQGRYFEPQMAKSNFVCDWNLNKFAYELILWNQQEESNNVVVISECDNTDGWSIQNDSGGDATLSTDSKVKMRNGGSIKGEFQNCQTDYFLRLIYTPSSPIDFTSKDYLAFWYWISKSIPNQRARVRLIDGSGNWGDWYFGDQVKENEFTRIIIPTSRSFDEQSATPPDKTNITEIQFLILPNSDWSKCVERIDRIVLDDAHPITLEIFLPDDFGRYKERDSDGKLVTKLIISSYYNGSYHQIIAGTDDYEDPYYNITKNNIYYLSGDQINSSIAVFEPGEPGLGVDPVANSDNLTSIVYSQTWGSTYRLGLTIEMPPSTLEKTLDKVDKIRLKIELYFDDWITSYSGTALETAYVGVAREYPPEAHASAHYRTGADPLTGELDANARVKILDNGLEVGTRRKINFKVTGSTGSLNVSDDPTNEKVDVELILAGGAGEYSIFGDGSDGDVTISTNTFLTRDMYYNNLTINEGVVLYTNGYRIFVRGKLTLNGVIDGYAKGRSKALPESIIGTYDDIADLGGDAGGKDGALEYVPHAYPITWSRKLFRPYGQDYEAIGEPLAGGGCKSGTSTISYSPSLTKDFAGYTKYIKFDPITDEKIRRALLKLTFHATQSSSAKVYVYLVLQDWDENTTEEPVYWPYYLDYEVVSIPGGADRTLTVDVTKDILKNPHYGFRITGDWPSYQGASLTIEKYNYVGGGIVHLCAKEIEVGVNGKIRSVGESGCGGGFIYVVTNKITGTLTTEVTGGSGSPAGSPGRVVVITPPAT